MNLSTHSIVTYSTVLNGPARTRASENEIDVPAARATEMDQPVSDRIRPWSRRHSAIFSAVVTIVVSLTVAACQPMIAREKQSTTNATYANPAHVRQ